MVEIELGSFGIPTRIFTTGPRSIYGYVCNISFTKFKLNICCLNAIFMALKDEETFLINSVFAK